MSITKIMTRLSFASLLIVTSDFLNASDSTITSRGNDRSDSGHLVGNGGCKNRRKAYIYNTTQNPIHYKVTFDDGTYKNQQISPGTDDYHCGDGDGVNIEYDSELYQPGRQSKTYRLLFARDYDFIEPGDDGKLVVLPK